MGAAGKGNAGENRAAAWLEAKGYVVGGRRHRPGGGDFLVVKFGGFDVDERPLWRVLLVEVKASAIRRGPYAHFRPAERDELLATAAAVRAEPWLIWTPTESRIEAIPADDWPEV